MIRSRAPLLRAADFQAAWYLSLVIFAIGVLVVAGVLLTERMVVPMWRAGDRSLATLIGAVAGVVALFFTLILTTVAVALAPGAVGGAR